MTKNQEKQAGTTPSTRISPLEVGVSFTDGLLGFVCGRYFSRNKNPLGEANKVLEEIRNAAENEICLPEEWRALAIDFYDKHKAHATALKQHQAPVNRLAEELATMTGHFKGATQLDAEKFLSEITSNGTFDDARWEQIMGERFTQPAQRYVETHAASYKTKSELDTIQNVLKQQKETHVLAQERVAGAQETLEQAEGLKKEAINLVHNHNTIGFGVRVIEGKKEILEINIKNIINAVEEHNFSQEDVDTLFNKLNAQNVFKSTEETRAKLLLTRLLGAQSEYVQAKTAFDSEAQMLSAAEKTLEETKQSVNTITKEFLTHAATAKEARKELENVFHGNVATEMKNMLNAHATNNDKIWLERAETILDTHITTPLRKIFNQRQVLAAAQEKLKPVEELATLAKEAHAAEQTLLGKLTEAFEYGKGKNIKSWAAALGLSVLAGGATHYYLTHQQRVEEGQQPTPGQRSV